MPRSAASASVARGQTLDEMLVSLPRLSREEADSFAKDLEKIRAELNRSPVRDPWGA